MDLLPENPLLQFKPDTLQYVRKQCGLDNSEKLKDSIDTLFEWIQKQDHFVKKDYSKEYLERAIIISEGSVETAKKRFDLISKFKTLASKYFEPFDMENSGLLKVLDCSFLPKMADDYSRVFMLKNRGQRYDFGTSDFFKYFIMINEYGSAQDYANGLTVIIDYTENDIKELTKAMNFVELQEILTIVLEGYNIKVKGFHFLTYSQSIDTYIERLKNGLSPRINQLIQVHEDVERLYQYVPKDIMPIEYGGKEKPLKELSDKTLEVLKSEEYTNYFNEMKRACTNEALRKEINNDHYKEIPEPFKMCSIHQ